VVYGDWQHRYHFPDGTSHLDHVHVSGAQTDVLEALLAGWWVSPACLLFRREAVVKSGGWDETLRAAQDRDFFTSVARSGATILYQPGCYSVYRRYGNVTVSTRNKVEWLENARRVLDKALDALQTTGRLSAPYRVALAGSYFSLARNYYDLDRRLFRQLMRVVLSLVSPLSARGFRVIPPHSASFRLRGCRTCCECETPHESVRRVKGQERV
jgi:GT2 family glycosyltransferase